MKRTDLVVMDMETYLAEIRPAVEHLLPALWDEREQFVQLESELQRLSSAVNAQYGQAQAIGESEVPDDDGLATMIYWETYFGPDKERHKTNAALAQAQAKAQTHAFAVAALAGTLLQFGKQGISIVHGELRASPGGRAIGSQGLKDVIWQGRNQGLHWEAGTFHPPVRTCFEALAREFDPKFREYETRNMAMDIVELLDWQSFDTFSGDMLGLA